MTHDAVFICPRELRHARTLFSGSVQDLASNSLFGRPLTVMAAVSGRFIETHSDNPKWTQQKYLPSRFEPRAFLPGWMGSLGGW